MERRLEVVLVSTRRLTSRCGLDSVHIAAHTEDKLTITKEEGKWHFYSHSERDNHRWKACATATCCKACPGTAGMQPSQAGHCAITGRSLCHHTSFMHTITQRVSAISECMVSGWLLHCKSKDAGDQGPSPDMKNGKVEVAVCGKCASLPRYRNLHAPHAAV